MKICHECSTGEIGEMQLQVLGLYKYGALKLWKHSARTHFRMEKFTTLTMSVSWVSVHNLNNNYRIHVTVYVILQL